MILSFIGRSRKTENIIIEDLLYVLFSLRASNVIIQEVLLTLPFPFLLYCACLSIAGAAVLI